MLGSAYGQHCCRQLGRVKQKERKKRNTEQTNRKRTQGQRELLKRFWKQPITSRCLLWAFVFYVLNSVATLFIRLSDPDFALKLSDTCLSTLPTETSIVEMKPSYKKAPLKWKGRM